MVPQALDNYIRNDLVALVNVWLAFTYNPATENKDLISDMYNRFHVFEQAAVTITPTIPREHSRPEFEGIPDALRESTDLRGGIDVKGFPVMHNVGNGRCNQVYFAEISNGNESSGTQEGHPSGRDRPSAEQTCKELPAAFRAEDIANRRHHNSDFTKKASWVEQ